MADKPRVSDEEIVERIKINERYGGATLITGRAILDLRDARAQGDVWKRSYEYEQTDAHKLRERVRELEVENKTFADREFDKECIEKAAKYNALYEAILSVKASCALSSMEWPSNEDWDTYIKAEQHLDDVLDSLVEHDEKCGIPQVKNDDAGGGATGSSTCPLSESDESPAPSSVKELEHMFAQAYKWEGHQEQYKLQRAGNCEWSAESGDCVLLLPERLELCAECWQDCPLSKRKDKHEISNPSDR